MFRSPILASPVITLLSSSPAASRRIQDIFSSSLFGLEPLPLLLEQQEDKRVSGITTEWDSVASKCPSSGAVIHLLSVNNKKKKWSTVLQQKDQPLSLLAITGTTPRDNSSAVDEVLEARRLLAKHATEHGESKWKLTLMNALGGSMTAAHILGKPQFESGLPLLSNLPDSSTEELNNKHEHHNVGLKEVCVPFYNDSKYGDGSSLVSTLSSRLPRPVVGLYQWNNTCIRPLPSATEDLSLPPPTLVFHYKEANDVDSLQALQELGGFDCLKIGYNGKCEGQVIVQHPELAGVEIRLCPSLKYSSSFCEAQDALLASSLDDLQNKNVLHGNKVDERLGDCWMEVRANLKHPSGFWKRQKRSGGERQTTTAKAPDLPYE